MAKATTLHRAAMTPQGGRVGDIAGWAAAGATFRVIGADWVRYRDRPTITALVADYKGQRVLISAKACKFDAAAIAADFPPPDWVVNPGKNWAVDADCPDLGGRDDDAASGWGWKR